MREVFVDTAGWGHFFVRTQPLHKQAVQMMTRWHEDKTKIVTTNYVLAELVALFVSPLRVARFKQIKMIETIKSTNWIEVVHVDPTLDNEAWRLLTQRQDKLWSLVDCSSMVVMKERNITTVLTTDHHFEQAGFIRALKNT